jgi:SNF2 family DNA or RNA helicase
LDLEIDTENIDRKDLLEVLEGYKLHKKYYRLKNGDFVNLEDESLQMLRELMDTMHLPPKDFVRGKMHLPMYRTLYLDKLLEEKEGVYTSRDHTFREMVKNFKTISDADYEVPESLRRVMRSYQKNGFKWLKTLESCQFGGILADDMGLGKTIQAISFLLSQKKEGVTSLVVAPASLVFNWGEEFERFGSELKVQLVTGDQQERQKKIEQYADYDVSVTSYDLLRRDIACYEDKKFTYQIIDEAQYIKNHTTAAAKAVKVIDSQMRIALTGTPIENRLSELWSIFDFLMPGFLYSYDVFKKEIETPAVKNADMDAMARLQRMVGPFIMRRLKTDVLKDLPDKLEEVRYVKFEKEQQTVYDAQIVHMREILAQQSEDEFNKNKIKVLAELTRLRQICCDPHLCFDNYEGGSAKLDSCIELVQSAMDSGHKMLLFSQFTSMLGRIRNRLEENGIPYYMITGETSKEKRLQLVKAFNEDDVPIFLISLKAGGVGLNLTGADVVIHYDPWWNAAAQNQATDRAHRIGQTKKVTVYKIIVRHSVEEKILKLQETKRDLAEQVMSGELGQLGSMSKEELMELLQG